MLDGLVSVRRSDASKNPLELASRYQPLVEVPIKGTPALPAPVIRTVARPLLITYLANNFQFELQTGQNIGVTVEFLSNNNLKVPNKS